MDRIAAFTPVKVTILVFSFLLAIALAVGGLFYFFVAQNIAPSLTLEVGETYRTEDFLIRDVPFRITSMQSDSPIQWNQPGQYRVTLRYLGLAHHSTLILVDTTPPDVTVQDVTALANQEITLEDFIVSCEDNTQVTMAFSQAPDMTLEGTQQVQLRFTDLGGNVTTMNANLTLTFDNEAPVITGCKDQTVYAGQAADIHLGVTVTDNLDEAPTLTIDEGGLDLEKAGTYTVTYTAADFFGNTSTATATITVILDEQAPQLFGVTAQVFCQGSTLAYDRHILITDDQDPAPQLTIDSSLVDPETPGTYDITYTVTDAAGNVAVRTASVTILEKPAAYVEEAAIVDAADRILAEILTDGMTPRKQVEAIYRYINENYRYTTANTDRTDRLQAAYQIMHSKAGNSFQFYAVTSLLLERLEIPQLCVERSPESVRPTRHYWSLVSIDGGETWYHVDTCPMRPTTDTLCLVTDQVLAELDALSPGYYTMDQGLYPATATEDIT